MQIHISLVHASTVFFHKSSLQEYGMFDEDVDILEDYDMWLRYCLVYNVRVRYIRKSLTATRIHKGQTTQRTSKKEWQKALNNVRKYVIEKLDSHEREKYESALRKYKIKFFFLKEKNFINSLILWAFPPTTAKKISNSYRRITNQKPSNWKM